MTAAFRRKGEEAIEVSQSWLLAEQISDASQWLLKPANAEIAQGSTLDIGFDSRLGDAVSVQGETVPCVFMRQLADLDICLWLSIYPPLKEAAAT